MITILIGVSSTGSVALTWKGHNAPSRVIFSGRKTEELVDETDFACRAGLGQTAVAATDHAHDLKPLDSRIGCFHSLETARRS